MSQGTQSSTYRRAAYLQAQRLGLPLPASPPPGPSKVLSPEYRRALMHQAQRLNLPMPTFDREGRELPALANGQSGSPRSEADDFLANQAGTGFKRTDAASPMGAPLASAPAPVTAAPGKPLSAMDRRAMYHADARRFGGVHERQPDGTAWSLEVSRENLEK
jgi:hypothetical protein